LNWRLQKTVLTGKISSLEVAETLFIFMEKTQVEFSIIQDELIKNLVEENLKKLSSSIASRAQVIVDILIRNLFERTADVGFLATDDDIIQFLKKPSHSIESKEFMMTRLREYILKYSVYDDIIILDAKKEVVINFDTSNKLTHTTDPILEQTLFGESEFCELFRHSDLQSKKEKSLIYTAKIVSENATLGILCLCFDIEDEMNMIFERLKIFNMQFALLASDGTVLSTNDETCPSKIPLKNFSNTILNSNEAISCIRSSKGYQGYIGQNWYGFAKSYYKTSFSNFDTHFPITIDELEKTDVISTKLKEIKLRSEDIIDDLADVVINGEIIASKRRSYALMPILDSIRKVSESINETIKESIQSIYITVSQSYLNSLVFKASLCLDIMDRNLYERANDCRWWSLNTTFRVMLNDPQNMDIQKINSMLNYINSLYTVYTNLFIYNASYTIIALSNDAQSALIGTKINGEVYTKTLANTNSQAYFVSNFLPTPLYNNQRTYIYNASICNFDHKNIGGIGIVFDSTPQFKAILDDVLDAHNQSALFCQEDGTIIATSSGCCFQIGDIFTPISEYIKTKKYNNSKIFEINGKKYFIGIAKSNGYREYKRSDNYTNDIYCAILAEI
jgi:hypothetical protein